MEAVIKILTENGWSQKGGVSIPSGVTRIAGGRWAAANHSFRPKFYLGTKSRCTIGKRTVSFYDVGENGPTNFRNYKTADIESIRKEIEAVRRKG